MQLHQLKPAIKRRRRKRVGRGGKRGTFSGRGSKGQKSRAGARIRPGFRGGDNPVWKLFPKQRGATKRVDIKHAKFGVKREKPAVVNLGVLDSLFQEGDTVSAKALARGGVIKAGRRGVKVLGGGELKKRFKFSGLRFSKSARDKILKAGGVILETSNKQQGTRNKEQGTRN
jgi:large subunit ribosomal protein L15